MTYTVGIDAGSAAVKVLAFADDRPVAWAKENTRADVPAQCVELLRKLLAGKALSGSLPDRVCATGYGRRLVADSATREDWPVPPATVASEIMANALGAGWMWRNWAELERVLGEPAHPAHVAEAFRTIVDVGGQDSKVVTFSADGVVEQFAMNDRCAAGTGRFLEVMACVLGMDLARLDDLAISSDSPAPISSACTVFAESEVISLLADGAGKGDVAAGIFQSVAQRVAGLAQQVGWRPPVMLGGGPARSEAMRRSLERAMGCKVAVPSCAEFTTALGAALFAAEAGEP